MSNKGKIVIGPYIVDINIFYFGRIIFELVKCSQILWKIKVRQYDLNLLLSIYIYIYHETEEKILTNTKFWFLGSKIMSYF